MSLRRLILAFAALLCLATPALAADGDPTFPALTGDVVDEANVLSPATEMVLTRELADLRHKTGHRLVVVTVASLQGREIADYGIRLFRTWKVGRAGEDDGAILLIAPNERTDRIEVGYKLEPVLTDAASKVILTDLRPRLKVGDYDGAALIGERAIVSLIAGPPGPPPPPKPTMDPEIPIWVWVILAGFAGLLLGAAWLVIWAVRMAIRSAKGAREAARKAQETAHGLRRDPMATSMQEEFDARWRANEELFAQHRAEADARIEAARQAARASGKARSATGADTETAEAISAAAVAAAAEWPEPSVFPETTPSDPVWDTSPIPAPTPPEPVAWPDPPTPAPSAAPDDSGNYTGGSAGGGGADDKW